MSIKHNESVKMSMCLECWLNLYKKICLKSNNINTEKSRNKINRHGFVYCFFSLCLKKRVTDIAKIAISSFKVYCGELILMTFLIIVISVHINSCFMSFIKNCIAKIILILNVFKVSIIAMIIFR